MRFRHLAPLLLLAACSGGAGDSDSAGSRVPTESVLVIDGDAATTSHVSARIAVVALERTGGELTGNLLREDGAVTFADPAGGTSGLRLGSIPAGEYVAVHLHFVADSAVETGRDGGRGPVRFERIHDRLPIGRTTVAPSTAPWLVVGHSEQLEIESKGGARELRHALWARLDEPHIVRDLVVTTLSVDPEAGTAIGAIEALRDLAVELDFVSAERLVYDDEELVVEDFVKRLETGDRLRVDALLVGWRQLRVLEAELIDDTTVVVGPREKTEILATVRETRPEAGEYGEVDVRLQMIERGGRDLPETRPLDLTLRFDARTQVKLMRGRGRWSGCRSGRFDDFFGNRSRNGSIEDLEAGATVEVRWRGPVDDRSVTVERIEIVAPPEPASGIHRWYEGTIASVDVAAERFELELAGSTFETIDVAGAVIVGTDSTGATALLGIGDLAAGDVAAALGVRAQDGSIRADLVRLR